MCAISVRKIFSLSVVAANLSVLMSFKINTDSSVHKSSLSYNTCSCRQLHTIFAKDANFKNKRPIGHIAHLRKLNTYDYIITLIWGRKKPLSSFQELHGSL